MKRWKRAMATVLCLWMLAAAWIPAGATEAGDKSYIGNRALKYVTNLWNYMDMCMETDLSEGTVLEYAQGLEEDPAEVWFDMDGEERSLEELCQGLRFNTGLAEESSLINEIFRDGPMENYSANSEVTSVEVSGDYGLVEIKQRRKFNYPGNPEDPVDTTQEITMEFLRLDGKWYAASCHSSNIDYEAEYRSLESLKAHIQDMKDNKEQLIQQQRQNRIDSIVKKIHDATPGKLATIIQTMKRAAYQALGVERKQAFT